MPMSKKKQILFWLTKGGRSQEEITRIVHVSKRDVSDCAKIVGEYGLTNAEVSAMSGEEIERRFFPPKEKEPNADYLQPDIASHVERKKTHTKLPVKYFHAEYVGKAAAEQKLAYSYQQFCRLF